jgi:glutathione S-transferase
VSDLHLTGFGDSVYTRAVRLALVEKDLAYDFTDVNPFSEDGQAALAGHHAFGRVPVLRHAALEVYETVAILGYLDDAFDGPRLTPLGAEARARMRQVMSIADAYVYWPLVRQVFSHGFYRLAIGMEAEQGALAKGMAQAPAVLDALENIAATRLVLTGREFTQADCLLFPMIDAFACVPEARDMLSERLRLNAWFTAVSERGSAFETRPTILSVEIGNG